MHTTTHDLLPLLFEQDHELTGALLSETRELIATPARWTRGALARNGRGTAVSPDDPHASRYCLLGAMLRVASDPLGYEVTYAAEAQAETYSLRGDEQLVRSFNYVGFLTTGFIEHEGFAVGDVGVEFQLVAPGEERAISLVHCIALLNDSRRASHAKVIGFVDAALRLAAYLGELKAGARRSLDVDASAAGLQRQSPLPPSGEVPDPDDGEQAAADKGDDNES